MRKQKNKLSQHYVNNADFLQELIKYKKNKSEISCDSAETLKIPEKIGIAIQQIANRLATKPNFSGYMFKDEMILDGIENCFVYLDNFNPEKSQNPFAYFTQIIFFAFLRRIAKEKKNMYVKHKLMEKNFIFNNVVSDDGNYDASINFNQDIVLNEYISGFVEDFEAKMKVAAVQKKNVKLKGIDVFLERIVENE